MQTSFRPLSVGSVSTVCGCTLRSCLLARGLPGLGRTSLSPGTGGPVADVPVSARRLPPLRPRRRRRVGRPSSFDSIDAPSSSESGTLSGSDADGGTTGCTMRQMLQIRSCVVSRERNDANVYWARSIVSGARGAKAMRERD